MPKPIAILNYDHFKSLLTSIPETGCLVPSRMLIVNHDCRKRTQRSLVNYGGQNITFNQLHYFFHFGHYADGALYPAPTCEAGCCNPTHLRVTRHQRYKDIAHLDNEAISRTLKKRPTPVDELFPSTEIDFTEIFEPSK